MLNFVWAQRAVKYLGPLQYTLSAHAKFSTFSVHNGEKPDTKNASYVRRKHFDAVSEGFKPPVPCGTPVFEAGSFNHSDNSPMRNYRNAISRKVLDVRKMLIAKLTKTL